MGGADEEKLKTLVASSDGLAASAGFEEAPNVKREADEADEVAGNEKVDELALDEAGVVDVDDAAPKLNNEGEEEEAAGLEFSSAGGLAPKLNNGVATFSGAVLEADLSFLGSASAGFTVGSIDPNTGGMARLGALSSLDAVVVTDAPNEMEADDVVNAAPASGEVLSGAPNATVEEVVDVAVVVDVDAAPTEKPPLGFTGSEVDFGAPNVNDDVEAVVDPVEDTAGAPKVNDEVADLAVDSPNLKVNDESPDLLVVDPFDAAGAPKVKVDVALELAPPRLNPPPDVAPAIILGPDEAAGAGADLPGLGVSQHMHLSFELSLGTIHVSQVHLAVEDAAAAGAVDPGLGVSQQTHFNLSSSF